MTEQEWLTSDDPQKMQLFVCENPDHQNITCCRSDRKLRLWACACWHAFTIDSQGWRNALWQLEQVAEGARDSFTWFAQGYACGALDVQTLMWNLAGLWLYEDVTAAERERRRIQCAVLLRDIVGNPFRPVTLPYTGARGTVNYAPGMPIRLDADAACSWLTPAVLDLAQATYDERQPDGALDHARIAVLADALMDAGCQAEVEEEHTVDVGVYPRPPDGWIVSVAAPFLMPRSPRTISVHPHRQDAVAWAEVNVRATWNHRGKRSWWGHGTLRANVSHPVLAHLRSPGPHVRGCWVVDLILGKE